MTVAGKVRRAFNRFCDEADVRMADKKIEELREELAYWEQAKRDAQRRKARN